ncbi:MAG: antibiotic biosynthesis monooxygenase [Chloroflexota bacterium]
MPCFVAIHHQARPNRLDDLLAALRNDFATSPTQQPGRKFARLFQHVRDPQRLLSMEEWQSQEEMERHAQFPSYANAVSEAGLPPRTELLERLQHYRHMPHRPTALACTTLDTPMQRAADVESFICDDERRDALVAAGLVIRAVYRVIGSPGRLLVLHGWRAMDDLERYFGTSARGLAEMLADTGASIDQFAGQVAAEFSWLEN